MNNKMIFLNLPQKIARSAKGTGRILFLRSLRSFAVSIVIAASASADYVTIGSPGVAADPATGYGYVNYSYQIGRYEVTGAEFGAAVAADPNIGNSNPSTGNKPAEYVSWYEAALYCNYLTSGDAYSGAYQFDSGGTYLGTDRDSAISTYGTVYALPTEDEWYKAAYWTGDDVDPWSLYANGTDDTPTWGTTEGWNYRDGTLGYATPDQRAWEVGYGAQEQNGTYDMMGNVLEWTESPYDSSKAVFRGGSLFYSASSMDTSARGGGYSDREYSATGFRVVVVPEPATVLLFGIGSFGAWILRRSKMRNREREV
jgi:formylglycine-generating enzyme